MSGNYSITANFVLDTYTLTYAVAANGSITAPATSPTTHNSGDVVTITALANRGLSFCELDGKCYTVADVNAASPLSP